MLRRRAAGPLAAAHAAACVPSRRNAEGLPQQRDPGQLPPSCVRSFPHMPPQVFLRAVAQEACRNKETQVRCLCNVLSFCTLTWMEETPSTKSGTLNQSLGRDHTQVVMASCGNLEKSLGGDHTQVVRASWAVVLPAAVMLLDASCHRRRMSSGRPPRWRRGCASSCTCRPRRR